MILLVHAHVNACNAKVQTNTTLNAFVLISHGFLVFTCCQLPLSMPRQVDVVVILAIFAVPALLQ